MDQELNKKEFKIQSINGRVIKGLYSSKVLEHSEDANYLPKKFIIVILVVLFSFANCIAQKRDSAKTFQLSIGRVAFGTGDLFGYSLSTELSKSLKKHFQIGAEATIENGKLQPAFSDKLTAFNQVSNISANLKIKYFPFNRIIKGLNIDACPVFGYQTKTEESEWTILYNNGVPYSRKSILKYTDQFFTGYRLSVNYDFTLKNKFLIGLRSDFSNYNNGDINTLIAIKTGFRFK